MLFTALMTLLAGALVANAVPHFVKGITRERYTSVLGTSPLVNVLAGWAGLAIGVAVAAYAGIGSHPIAAAVGGALGTLLLAVFHAHVGAFGKRVTAP